MTARSIASHPVLWVAVVLAALTLLWLALGAPVQLITQIAIYTLYGAGVNLLVGYTGLVHSAPGVLRHIELWAAFFLLGHFGNEFVARPVGAVLGVLGLVIGRSSAPQGPHFSLLTLVLADRLRGRLQVDRYHRWRERPQGVPRVSFTSDKSFHVSWWRRSSSAWRCCGASRIRHSAAPSRRYATTSSARRASATTSTCASSLTIMAAIVGYTARC
jgi:ABC-type branched-subunit amino acid transport system permease subunit